MTHGARQITSSFRSVCGSTLEAFFTSLASRTQSLYVLCWDAIVLSSSSNNDDDDGGDDYDGDDDGDGDGDGEEKIPQVYIYKLPINRPSGRILEWPRRQTQEGTDTGISLSFSKSDSCKRLELQREHLSRFPRFNIPRF